jgi:hypothetical protein
MHQPRAVSVQREGAMNTESSGSKWVLRSVVETLVLIIGLSLFGSLTLTLIG